VRILIVTVQIPFVHGGAEVLANDLLNALRVEGHEAEIVTVPFRPNPPDCILDQMLACCLFDLSNFNDKTVDRIIALKFPAYLIPHSNKVLWLVHQHRTAYELWGHELGDMQNDPRGIAVRDAIREADRQLIPESRAVFTISKNVTRRLRYYTDVDSIPLYPPVRDASAFYCAEEPDEYLFFPSRLSRPKRQELVLKALALTQEQVCVQFTGVPDDPRYGEELKQLAIDLKLGQRVKWLGRIPEQEKRDAYARAIGVIFPPVDEDYGYVTLEAMLSSKAVLTCLDSGGPLEFVEHEKTGLIAKPNAQDLARAFDRLWRDRALAAEYGCAGRKVYDQLDLSWPNTVTALLA
jgi:glycosyltransferase involved in cell wall biosynthesis